MSMSATSTATDGTTQHRKLRLTTLVAVAFVAGMYTQARLEASTQDPQTTLVPCVEMHTTLDGYDIVRFSVPGS